MLAGGFGTRLKSTLNGLPKALAPACGVPFLQLQISNWRKQGVNEFSFLLHHESDQMIGFLEDQQNDLLRGCDVNWCVESVPMDTGGAVAYGASVLNFGDSFLVTNADTWMSHGIKDLSDASAPTVGVIEVPDVGRYGKVSFDNDSVVTSFDEKNANGSAGWINSGLCHLSTEYFIDWDGKPFSLERDLFPRLVENKNLKAMRLKTDFIDIGVPNDYLRFCNWISKNHQVVR